MSLEAATFINQLNVANPTGADSRKQGDDHIRLVKSVLKNQFPNFGNNPILADVSEVNYLDGVTSSIQTQLDDLDAAKADASVLIDYARLDTTQAFSKNQHVIGKILTVTAGQTVRTSAFADYDGLITNNVRIIAQGSFSIETPLNMDGPGRSMMILIDQSGGPWSINFSNANTGWRFQFGVEPQLTQIAGAVDLVACYRFAGMTGLVCTFIPNIRAIP